MAINAYCGLMGSGKSYEVVSEIIVPAIAQGRRVVSNVEGLNQDEIWDYLDKNGGEGNYGTIVHVGNDQVHDPNFWYSADDGKVNEKMVVQPGDLVCIDEAWRFFGTGQKLDDKVMIFLREHRHFVHAETGVSCDLVLMTQDISDLCRQIKNVVEMSTRTVKLKSLGLHTRYRVEVYEGYRLAKGSFIAQQQKKYNKEIFPLYQSYKGGSGKEVVLDDRQNIWKQPSIWLFLIGGPIALIFCGYTLMNFFTPKKEPTKPKPKPAVSAPAMNPMTPQIGPDGKPMLPPLPPDMGGLPPGMAGAPGGMAMARPSLKTTFSPTVRYIGFIEKNNEKKVILNDSGKLRLASPSQGSIDGIGTLFNIDGEKVTTYSGASRAAEPANRMWNK